MKNITRQNLLFTGMLMLATNLAMAATSFTPGSQPTGWVSTPDVTAYNVSDGTEIFYQIDFHKDTWAGNLIARHINAVAQVQSTGPWDGADPTLVTAASVLDSTDYNTGRKIVTFSADGGRVFRWANMTGAEQTALGSEAVLNFVRGDRSNEEPAGLFFRAREWALGDIIHSNIIYWDYGSSQSLFVGANDGMFHSFNAADGSENWAYIPSMVIPNLSLLTAKPYTHTYFVDGPMSIANIDYSGTVKTFLVSGLGAGGPGLFGLDVSSSAAATEAAVADKVKWEISATGSFANLGYVYGSPKFARLNDNSGTAAVFVGNGYMNAGNGHAVLYIINADTGALISAIDTGSGSADSPNGLSTPALYDDDNDGTADYAYAGDIDGHLWKFDLTNYSSSLLMTTSGSQAITSAPVVDAHPLGGRMVAFATGRFLTSGDKEDTSVHHVYGIWDGAPDANDAFLTQTQYSSTFGGTGRVRNMTDNIPDWTEGIGHHKGWKIALPAGERVVGERTFYHNGRFYFTSTNPTLGTGDNWLHEPVFMTGGSPAGPIFDLSDDGKWDSNDLDDDGLIPVAKYLGDGVFSQPRLVNALDLATTLYAFHPDLPLSDNGEPTPPDDPGVSGGHFDYDIYYYEATSGDTNVVPDLSDSVNVLYCKEPKDASKHLDEVYNGCQDGKAIGVTPGYTWLSDYSTGGTKCNAKDPTKKADKKSKDEWLTLTCNPVTSETSVSGDYKKIKHVHEYDDKYDVTGVNMLNASLPDFNLVNALPDPTTEFKILVMNQYLNPAAKLSVGGEDYENVQTYGNLASETDAQTLLDALPVYSRATIDTFIFNLPLDAFKSKDWWGDGGVIRAGLIPTQTGCVNKVDEDGVVETPGKFDERFNGALTFQLIRPDTPSNQLELNGPDVTYGWRVKGENFKSHVLAEYTTFWHHPNKWCYDDDEWIPDPPEDFDAGKTEDRAEGSADPTDGVFGAGLAVSTTTVEVVDNVTTTTVTYSDGTTYTKTETVNQDGTTTVYSVFRDGTTEEVTIGADASDGGRAGYVDPLTGSPEEDLSTGKPGRQSWRDLLD